MFETQPAYGTFSLTLLQIWQCIQKKIISKSCVITYFSELCLVRKCHFPHWCGKAYFCWICNRRILNMISIILLNYIISWILQIMRFHQFINVILKIIYFQRELDIHRNAGISIFIFMSWSIISYGNLLINLLIFSFNSFISVFKYYYYYYTQEGYYMQMYNS